MRPPAAGLRGPGDSRAPPTGHPGCPVVLGLQGFLRLLARGMATGPGECPRSSPIRDSLVETRRLPEDRSCHAPLDRGQLFEQSFRLLQIRGFGALGKPLVHANQELVRSFVPTLVAVQTSQAGRGS